MAHGCFRMPDNGQRPLGGFDAKRIGARARFIQALVHKKSTPRER